MRTGMAVFLALILAQMVGAQTIFRKVETKKPGFNLTAKVPVFTHKTPVALTTNSAMMAWVKSAQLRFAKESGKPTKDSVVKEYTWDAAPTISYFFAPRLASVLFNIYSYTGGAHPNSNYQVFNFGMIDGKAKRLKITDLFRKGTSASDIKQQISDLVINKLRLDERASFAPEKLTEAQLDSFVIKRDGITYLFAPYEVGPYAAGDFEIELSLSELGPDFRRALIRAR